ncbi:MAG: hypothetical protein SFY80_14425 [Verrucomicrobiota bacterium]|nr:hypothetical protein [Verrucomicrobiota bacterium]
MKYKIFTILMLFNLLLSTGCMVENKARIEIESIRWISPADTSVYNNQCFNPVNIFKTASGFIVVNVKSKINIYKYAYNKGATIWIQYGVGKASDERLHIGYSYLFYDNKIISPIQYDKYLQPSTRNFNKDQIIAPGSNGYYNYNIVLFVSNGVDKQLPELLESGNLYITIRGGAPFGMGVYKFKPIIITKEQIDSVLKEGAHKDRPTK